MRKAWNILAVCAILIAGAIGLAPSPPPVLAQDGKPDTAVAHETEEEKMEREGRRRCAIAVCLTLHNKRPADGRVSCSVRKTWRKDVLTAILSRGRISWPWGDTRCSSEVSLDRNTLIKAMQEPEYEAQFDTYDIRCEIDNEKEKYAVTVQVRPRITFKQGKAVKAAMNWGKIEAPTLAKSALWSITAADNTFGLLQSIAVEDINEFVSKKCMEVKEEWQGK
jgi:hypothetical protein